MKFVLLVCVFAVSFLLAADDLKPLPAEIQIPEVEKTAYTSAVIADLEAKAAAAAANATAAVMAARRKTAEEAVMTRCADGGQVARVHPQTRKPFCQVPPSDSKAKENK